MSSQVKIKDGKISYVEILKKMKYDLQQNIISCGLVNSLKDVSLMQIAIGFYQHVILDDVKNYLYSLKISSKIYFGDFLDKFNYEVILMNTELIIPLLMRKRLEVMLTMIKEDIYKFFLDHRFYSFKSLNEIEKMIIYCDNLCFTPEGKINKKKTVENIIENANLSTRDKYLIACNNCLKEKIPDLLEKLPNSFITEIIENDVKEENSGNFKQFRLVLFWTFHFREENERFIELINGASTSEYLIKWAICNKQEPALQYLWENYADETIKQNLGEFIDFSYQMSFPDLNLLYLFNQMTNIKLSDLISVNTSKYLVETLNRISKHYNIVLVPDYVIDFINANNVSDALNLVWLCWKKRFVDLNSYNRIWEMFEIRFKNEINENFYLISDSVLPLDFKILLNFYPFKLLLKMRTFQQKFDILSQDRGKYLCLSFVFRGELNTFEQFLKDVFDSEEEISFLKLSLLSDSAFVVLCFDLYFENKLKYLEEVLIKFCAPKSKLPYENNAYAIETMLTDTKDTNLLASLDNFISWCCEENEDEINKCKSELFDLKTDLYITNKQKFFNIIEDRIKKNEWDLVKNYWKWIFSATENKIMTQANKLIRIKDILYFGSRQKFCEFLMRFITSCFTEDEIYELKEELKINNVLFTFVRDMLELEDAKYSKIDDLLDWCYTSNKDEIDKFKKKFISIYKIELSEDNNDKNSNKKRRIEEASQSETKKIKFS